MRARATRRAATRHSPAPRRKKRSRSTPSWAKLASAETHFSVMRSTLTAPAASGLAGADIGSPVSRTFSISTGHSVTGQAVRKRQRLAVHRLGLDRQPGRQAHRDRQLRLRSANCAIDAEGNGREIMRIKHAEQRVGQLGEFVVEPVVHAGGEKRHAFQQPRDMRIVDAFRRQPQPAGDLRVRLGKLGRQPADRGVSSRS